ncbi:methyltransferase domain-containing protein [Amycolatopsis sacchari]|uniref:Methyltransferase domain-containing protein n=1 Tax=Amycolatopsis sacchari TaxID=115433 RepID=A0A1I3KB23_9PSEU|nr:class I SAM-dependent methyltransferase [Amycolatopsis sacchari]SFI69701.1 Methyltransferase domain-containing protein [Amycolatopsis sacchari]
MTPGFSPDWLALREKADAAARAAELVEPLLAVLPPGPLVIHDLGCGTGSMARWLAPLLPRAQRWVLHDRDPVLLAHAAKSVPVPVETRAGDLTRLRAADLAGASLVTASALLDLLTADEVEALADACTGAGCPALLTLSVAGEVELSPAEPLDLRFAAAFDDHQRRTVDGRTLLGPDAVRVATEAFVRRGAVVHSRRSPWRLGPGELFREWLRGWVEAACEQQPQLRPHAAGYLSRRLGSEAVVGHVDLLAIGGAPCSPDSGPGSG